MSLASGALLLLVSNYASAVSVFGVDLGLPLSMPECSYQGTVASPRSDGPCYVTTDRKSATVESRGAYIKFPSGSLSNLSKNQEFGVSLVGGSVEAVTIWTGGIRNQDSDLATLIAKFGQPASVSRVPWQNGFGATYESIRANWSLADGTKVGFDSGGSDLTEGEVSIRTKVGEADYERTFGPLLKKILGTEGKTKF